MENRKKQSEKVTISLEEYEKLIGTNKNLADENVTLKNKVNWLEECLKLKNKKVFGSSSEKTTDEMQLSLFNEAEALANEKEKEPVLEEVKAHYRKKRISAKDRLPEDMPIEVIEHKLKEEETDCPQCKQKLHEIGKEVIREELKIIPAKAVIVRHVRYSYGCRNCERNDITSPVIKAPVPSSPVKGGFASPQAVAYIMCQKYVLDVPLYRQEQEFKRRDILLSRQTMSTWLIKCAENWITPLYERLKEELLKCKVIHCDETTVQVLKEPAKKAQSKSYMWLYRSGGYEERSIAIYDYQSSRSGKHVENFLESFSGYVHCDGYSGYKKLSAKITLSLCFAHARRKFSEAVSILTPEQKKESKAVIGLNYINKLFDIEQQMKHMSVEQRYKERQERAKPILDEFFAWLNSFSANANTHLGRAVSYTLNQWKGLNAYLLDGRLEISNNLAEHMAKSFAVCRKNFLFCNTPKGAKASAVTYSIIATAMAAGIDPFEYLAHIFTKAPNVDMNDPKEVQALLPWEYVAKNPTSK